MFLCPPALVYVILAMVGILGSIVQKASVLSTVIKLIMIGMWTWVINYLCMKGWKGMAWFLAFLPWVVVVLFLATVVDKVL